MTRKVKKMSVFISLVVIPLGVATAGLAYKTNHVKQASSQVSSVDTTREAEAPFRDGLYVGGLDAKGARKARPSVGRWSDSKDRASFLVGYQRGYDAVRGTEIAEHSR